jgi:hypothetical protein
MTVPEQPAIPARDAEDQGYQSDHEKLLEGLREANRALERAKQLLSEEERSGEETNDPPPQEHG